MYGLVFVFETHRFRCFGHQASVCVVEFDLDGLVGGFAVAVVKFYGHIERSGSAVGALVADCDIVVAHEGAGCGVEIHIAVYSAEAPHVLSLKIRTVAPAVDLYRQLVVARSGESADVEFGHIVGALRVSGKASVDPHRAATVDSVEVNEHALSGPVVGHGEVAAVAPGGVVIGGDNRRIGRKNIFDVRIDRFAVTLQFPI